MGKPVVRCFIDSHVGHPCPPVPLPFHRTRYANPGQTFVTVEGVPAVVIGGSTACGDVAATGASFVIMGGNFAHRATDGTTGHGCFVPNAAASGSLYVLAE